MEAKLSRRSFLRMMAGASTALAAAACAAPAPAPAPAAAPQAKATEPAKAPAPAAGAVTLQFMWWPVGGERGLKAIEDVMKPFEAANANIKVERSPVSTNYFDKLLTMFAGGTPPDVMAIDNYDMSGAASKGVLMELDPLIQADKSFSLDDFFPAALAEGTWNNKRFALPYIGSTRIMFYNADLFAKKGLDTPDKLWEAGKWTWEALQDYAKKLTDTSGGPANTVYGFTDDRQLLSGGVASWIYGAKGDILDRNFTKCMMNTPEAVAGVRFMQDLIFKDQVAPKADALKDVDLPATGRVAMWMSWRGLSMAYRAYSYKWDVVPFPMGVAGKTTMYKGNSMSVAKATKHQPEAWLLAKHVTGSQADKIYVGNGGATPRKDNKDVLMQSTPPQNNQYFYNPLNEGWARGLPLNPKFRTWAVESQKYMDRIFNDNEDVQKVMNDLAPVVDKILKEA
jgi:multiple sugar transport system substrate-binding protein